MADIRFTVSLDDKGSPVIRKLEDGVEGLGKAGKDAGNRFGGLWKQFALGQIATEALRGSWRLLKNQIADSFKAAIEAEQVDKALDAALDITGRKLADLGDHYKEYASQLQAATRYGDEEIKTVQTLLIQMTNLDREGLDRATRGTLGLASALGMDLNAASLLVQKAMAGQFQTLSRYGIVLDESLTADQKKAALLEKLDALYLRATADAGSYAGRLDQLKNRWNDVQEAAGGWITQQKGIIELLNKASQAVLDYLTMNEMLEESTGRQVEQENRLSDRLGKAAAAAGWKYREMANLIAAYDGNYAALIRDINQEKHGVEIKLAYIAAIRREKVAWLAAEEARKKAERGTNNMGEAVKVATKLINTELVAIRGLNHALVRLADTELPLPKGLPAYQAAWLGIGETATQAESVWDSAMQSMIAGIVSFGDATSSILANVGSIFSNFVKSAIAGMEALILKHIWESKVIKTTKQGEAQAYAIASIFDSLPWFVALPVAAGSFAIINALFSKILKFEQGGVFTKPTIAEIGHGTEYVLPEKKLVRIVQQAMLAPVQAARIPAVAGGGQIVNHFHIHALDGADVLTITRRKIIPVIQRQLAHGGI